ncbi:MAG: MerT mercuric transport protein [Bacteroidota bacterium]|jgi:hypothetical protein
MNKLKSIWTTITGSISSIIPLFFACCKSGACVGVCASPVASLFGISTAGFATSPWFSIFEPLLIALSAVSFTVSYYGIYVLPKFNNCNTDCDCNNTKPNQKEKLTKAIFWIGLSASIICFTYFETQKFKANHQAAPTECATPCTTKSNADSLTIKNKPCCSNGTECK